MCCKNFDQESETFEMEKLCQEQRTVNSLVEMPHFDQCAPDFCCHTFRC